MIEIGINDIKKNFGFKPVLNGVSFEVNTNDRICIIGNNGCGKSTILKIINGMEQVDSGIVSIRKDASIGFLNQIPQVVDEDVTVKEIIKKENKELIEIERRLENVTLKLSEELQEDELKYYLKKYSNLNDLYISKMGYVQEEKFSKICSGCNLNSIILEKRYNNLSGGEKTLVNLARILYGNPDILLLDEPTNHLDSDTLEWLENFLKSYKGTVLFVSHDRYFIDRLANKTLLIENGKSELFYGNYTYFLEEDERRTLAQFENFKNQQKQIHAMKESIKKLREFGTKSNDERFFRRANSIQKKLDKIELIDKPNENKKLTINFNIKDRSGKEVIIGKKVGLSFDGNEILKSANFELFYNERVGIIGKNGTGKSSFINLILGENKDYTGNIKIGESVKIGYIPQEIRFEDESLSVLQNFRKFSDKGETEIRATLSKFMFCGDLVFKKLNQLSGGEKVRLKLAQLMENEVNLIILDEPTNHIDINTREVLEQAILDYKGTVLFISHDRYFLNKIATRIVELKNKNLYSYNGNYEEYKNTHG